MLYIVIGLCCGTGSSPIVLTQSKSIMQLVHPELTRALTPACCAVVSISKCTEMESLCFSCFSFFSKILSQHLAFWDCSPVCSLLQFPCPQQFVHSQYVFIARWCIWVY